MLKKVVFSVILLAFFGLCMNNSKIAYSQNSNTVNSVKALRGAIRVIKVVKNTADLFNMMLDLGDLVLSNFDEKKEQNSITKKDLTVQFDRMVNKMKSITESALENQDKRRVIADLRAAINYISAEKFDKAFDKLNESWSSTVNFLSSNTTISSKEWDLVALQIVYVWKKLSLKLKNHNESKKWNKVLHSIILQIRHIPVKWKKQLSIPYAAVGYSKRKNTCRYYIATDFVVYNQKDINCSMNEYVELSNNRIPVLLKDSLLIRKRVAQIIKFLLPSFKVATEQIHSCKFSHQEIFATIFNQPIECKKIKEKINNNLNKKNKKMPSIVGQWTSLDSNTNKPATLIEIYYQNGLYYGRIKSLSKKSNHIRRCTMCPGKLKNKPIIGLNILWNLRKVSKNKYTGIILNFNQGKTYKCNVFLSTDGMRLKVQAWILLFHRSTIWYRNTE